MSYLKTKAALETHLQGVAADRAVFFDHPHTPAHEDAYIASVFIPGKSKTVLLGPDLPKEHRGSLKLTVHETTDHGAMIEIDALCTHFKHGQVLVFDGHEVHLEKVEVGPNKTTLTHTNIPVTISWRCYF